MDSYLKTEHWVSLLRDIKDSEKEKGFSGHEIERIAKDILDFASYTRIRQYNLFTQKRGQDFESMIAKLNSKGYSMEAVDRMLTNEEFWKTTLELAED